MPEADAELLGAVVREAGLLALARTDTPGRVVDKPDGGGPVSEADLATDAFLRERLLAARPGYGWLSEETADTGARLGTNRLFIVDPIDGTRAFLAGKPTWAISAAVVDAGEVIAGIVHMPALGKTYVAERGGGARRNGRPISASTRATPDGADVLTSSSQLAPHFWPGGVPAVQRHFRPSIAYRLCLVAEGRFDATVTFRRSWEWDVAAGDLIIREAGGAVTDADGLPLVYNSPDPRVDGVIAASAPLHAALLARR